MDKPKITSIIVHMNSEVYQKTIDSFMNQTYKEKQMVFVDGVGDASNTIKSDMNIFQETDEHGNHVILGTYDNCPCLLITVGESNKNYSYLNNIGIKHGEANSDVFMFLNSNDELYNNTIEKFINEWTKHASFIGAMYSDFIDENQTRHFMNGFDRIKSMTTYIEYQNLFVSKQAIQMGLYDEQLNSCENFDMINRIATKFLIMHIPSFLIKRGKRSDIQHVHQASLEHIRQKGQNG